MLWEELFDFSTPAQVQKLEIGLATQLEAIKNTEIHRMKKVNDAWPKHLAIWATFGVIGLALRFLLKHDSTRHTTARQHAGKKNLLPTRTADPLKLKNAVGIKIRTSSAR